MKKLLKGLLLIIVLIAIAFIVIVYLFGLPKNVVRVTQYENLSTEMWIDGENIDVEQKFLISELVPKEQEKLEENVTEEYRLILPIQNKYGYKVTLTDISSISSNISFFNLNSNGNIKYRDGEYIVQIAPGQLDNLRKELLSNNNIIKLKYRLKSYSILLKNDDTQNVELKVETSNSFLSDNNLIIHLENGVKVLNQENFIIDSNDNTCTISLKGFSKTYIINFSINVTNINLTSSNENGLIYKYMLDRICDTLLMIISIITVLFIILMIIVYFKRIVKAISVDFNSQNYSIEPALIDYAFGKKVDAKKLISLGIFSKKWENILKFIRALIRLNSLIIVLVFFAIIVLEKSNANYVIICTGLLFINIIVYSFTKVHVFTKEGKKEYQIALAYKKLQS